MLLLPPSNCRGQARPHHWLLGNAYDAAGTHKLRLLLALRTALVIWTLQGWDTRKVKFYNVEIACLFLKLLTMTHTNYTGKETLCDNVAH